MSPSLFILLITSQLFPCSQNARILGIFAMNFKSHFLVPEAIMKALAERSHEVVVVNHFPQKTYLPNYTDIDISESLPGTTDNVTTQIFLENRFLRLARFAWFNAVSYCKTIFSYSKMQTLLNSNENFDLVIVEMPLMECFAGFSYKFQVPLIGVVTRVPPSWVHQRLGNPDNPAYNPGHFLPYTNKMNFWQRMSNTLTHIVLIVGNHLFCDEPTNVLLKQQFRDEVPTIQDVLGKTSVLLVNTHFSITEPRPTVPGYVEVGGLHIREPKSIPRDILDFMEGAEHGVVYFSMGSLVQVQSFPPEKIQALLDTFAELPERVMMKYTGDKLQWTPRNVMVSKWLPQIDILCHPKTKLFISHGGMLSVQESVKCGVPLVGIPLFADQHLNINRLKELGMALKLDYEQINTEGLLSAIRTVIDLRIYSENAKRVSALFKDRPMAPLDTAVYWVEYVIRHRGAPHLRSVAADMPLYQYLLLDVIGFLLLAVIVLIFVVQFVVKSVIRVLMFRKIKHD